VREKTIYQSMLILICTVNRVVTGVRRKLMTRRKRTATAGRPGRFVVNGEPSGRKETRVTGSEPVTSERMFETFRYLHEDAFRPRRKR